MLAELSAEEDEELAASADTSLLPLVSQPAVATPAGTSVTARRPVVLEHFVSLVAEENESAAEEVDDRDALGIDCFSLVVGLFMEKRRASLRR